VGDESIESGESQGSPEQSGAQSVSAPSESVWTRIKDHKIAQWTLAYAAAALALLEGAKLMSDAFEWPHQVLRIVTVLLILGLPLVVTLAWFHGHRALRRASGAELTIITVLLVVAGAVLWHFAQAPQEPSAVRAATTAPTTAPATPTIAISDKSIAVLPFVDMSEKHDQEYFADGMAEEILDLLAKIPGLHVPARTSSFYFKGKSEDIPTIARRLMVANVLEGSIRKSGNQVRVTVQLVRADNGYHLWSETYDRTPNDLFKVQDEIAGEVVKALKISMGTSVAPRTVPTNSAEAHSLLLQAQFWYYRATADGRRRAASYYQQAIDIDPDFAEAWAGLSKALVSVGLLGGQDWHHARELALHAAERAVALDPKLAAAHDALGAVRYWLDWDWPAANTEYETARLLDPDNSEALVGLGRLAAAHGRLTDALRLWELAAARDPLNYYASDLLADTYYSMGRSTEAVAAARKTVDLAPTGVGAHGSLAQTLLAAGQKDEALAEVEKESDPGSRAYALAWIFIVLERKGDADTALADFEKNFAAGQVYNIATLHALRGDRDQAFSWLNRAYQQHDPGIIATPPITVDPDLKNLHDDPRWAAFLRKLNLP
jgi:TolB-like protein/Tfp pilus assembly protein PilF